MFHRLLSCLLYTSLGIRLITYSKSIGPIACDPRHFDAEEILKNPVYMPDADAAENAMAYLEACIAEQNSSGGVDVYKRQVSAAHSHEAGSL